MAGEDYRPGPPRKVLPATAISLCALVSTILLGALHADAMAAAVAIGIAD
jgi:hypothetical protein